jgi:hypothetical protein
MPEEETEESSEISEAGSKRKRSKKYNTEYPDAKKHELSTTRRPSGTPKEDVSIVSPLYLH